MAIKHRNQVKASFKTGAIPTEADFGDLIDSALNLDDDGLAVDANKRLIVGAGAPTARLTVQGDFDVSLSGTIAVPAAAASGGNVTATGVGTKFTKELTAGAKLRIGNVELTVVSIAGDLQMTVTRAAGAAVPASQGFVRGELFSVKDAEGVAQFLVDGTGAVAVAGTIIANHLQGDGSLIRNLDAGSITSGSIAAARLPAAVTGPIDASRIPDLDANKIATGTINAARLPAAVTGPIDASRIPNLDASKIATGTIQAARLPDSLTLKNLEFISPPSASGAILPGSTWKVGAGLEGTTPILGIANDAHHGMFIEAAGNIRIEALEVSTGDLRVTHGKLSGDGSGLVKLSATNLTGILPPANGGTGVNTTGAAGNILRSNGTAWESARLQAADVPDLHLNFIQNTTAPQAASNFNISGTGKAQILEASQQFNMGGLSVLSIGGAVWGNLFVGIGAGYKDTTGTGNTFVGLSAGTKNTGGQDNTFVGAETGGGNTTGNNNSFFGENAGPQNTTGSFNTFVGTNAGTTNSTGQGNTFVGEYAGHLNTTGSYNLMIGQGANTGSSDLSNATAIGARAQVTQSNSLVLGSIAGVNAASSDTMVGIGTTAPGSLLTLRASSQTAPALEIYQGALKVTGAGINTKTFVMIHEVTAANLGAGALTTIIDNPHANGDPNAILIITPSFHPGDTPPNPVYVAFSAPTAQWVIAHFDITTQFVLGQHFNMLIVKP